MTQSDFHQLSLEQQLKLECLKMKMQLQSTDSIKSQNVDVYREMIEMENYYKKLVKEKWGLNETK